MRKTSPNDITVRGESLLRTVVFILTFVLAYGGASVVTEERIASAGLFAFSSR